jgi:hypothetical protein
MSEHVESEGPHVHEWHCATCDAGPWDGKPLPEPRVKSKVEVGFIGGPWDSQTTEIDHVVAPVFAAGHQIGSHYWLDTKSAGTPMYHWDGTPWEMKTDQTLQEVLGITPEKAAEIDAELKQELGDV